MMPSLWTRLAVVLVLFVILAFVVREEIGWRQERARLGEQIAAAQKLVQEADARQRERDAELRDALRQIAQRKQQIQTPQQIVRELPRELPLPAPVALVPAGINSALPSDPSAGQVPTLNTDPRDDSARDSAAKGSSSTGASQHTPITSHLPQALIPAEDLKPLYDFVMDCKACQAQLSAATSNLADERAKNAALSRERDAALRMARGGGFWRRVGRAAKWFALMGAAAGAAIASAR